MKGNSKKEQKFSEAYEKYAASVYRHVRLRVGSTEDAEDIVSKCFMKTWDYMMKGKTIVRMKPFIFRVANNLIIDWYRAKDSRPIPMEDVEEAKLFARDDRLDDLIDARMGVEELERALDQVEPAYRDVLVLKYVEQLDVRKIAKKLDVSENVVYVRIHRGRKKLVSVMLSSFQHPFPNTVDPESSSG